MTGLIGRLDLNGTWWAGFPGVDAADGNAHAPELITGLIGRTAAHEVLATDPWTARLLVADRFAAGRVFLAGEAAHVNPPWAGTGSTPASAMRSTSPGRSPRSSMAGRRRNCWAATKPNAAAWPSRRSPAPSRTCAALAGDLPADAAAIQRVKKFEFYSLGLVLGYSYAGSPLIQPGAPPSPAADTTSYTPAARPGARLPHAWSADGTSLYDRLGTGFTLLGPAGRGGGLAERARGRGIPLAVAQPPPDYPWRDDFLLVRPDQHIAWRAGDPDSIDLGLATGVAATTAGRP